MTYPTDRQVEEAAHMIYNETGSVWERCLAAARFALIAADRAGWEERLVEIHGSGNCHICGEPKVKEGKGICSYPHRMLPDEEVSPGMWSWRPLPSPPQENGK